MNIQLNDFIYLFIIFFSFINCIKGICFYFITHRIIIITILDYLKILNTEYYIDIPKFGQLLEHDQLLTINPRKVKYSDLKISLYNFIQILFISNLIKKNLKCPDS